MRVILLKKSILVFFLAIIMAGVGNSVYATHLRAGEITVRRIGGCPSLTFEITITVYTNTDSPIRFGGNMGFDDILDFGDGTRMQVPEQPNTPLSGFDDVGKAFFKIQHTYGGPGKYLISYREPNRNGGVLNMDNSLHTRFYLETLLDIDPFKGCNDSPVLLIPPVDQACPGVAFMHNPGAYDPNGDSLSFEMVVPYSDVNLTVVNYRDPNHPGFYSNYNTANEAGNGQPTFAIDPITGTLTWDSPGATGEYNIAFVIKEWRKVRGIWYQIGFVRRDMQIIVEDCNNKRPDLEIPQDTCVEAGTQLKAIIYGTDPENRSVQIEPFSEIFAMDFPSRATYSPDPVVPQPSNPPAQLEFEWNTDCDHVRAQPYQVVFKITDDPPNPNWPKLVTFKTWNITVVAPAPVVDTAYINLATRSTQLEWDPYICDNAEKMQIWRRVDSFAYDPANCETGMPEFMGYSLIDEVNIMNNPITTYTDTNGGKGLAAGAKYCYRLVAIFPLPRGGESYMSEEICVGPFDVDAPVITKVSVDKTGFGDGEITVQWEPPFEATSFPPPYSYEIWRGVGFTGTPTTKIHTGRLSATTITDTGLNTEVQPYNYYVIAFDDNDVVVDTSAVASSVWLDAKPGLDRIELNWEAFVPWSNRSQVYPRHLIYRSTTGSSEADMELIDSVDVNINGFVYVDTGQWNGVPLDENTQYCYRVMTRGVYGNSLEIDEPLENFSQIVCDQLGDEEPPCKPEPPTPNDPVQCDDYADALNFICNQNIFSNQINWNRPAEVSCLNDIVSYNVYVSSVKGGSFVLQQTNVRDTFYIDSNLPSFARCYKISAVDRSGNESELSDAMCIDNCPYYELPNVFSPNGDDCNDTFSAYSDKSKGGENGAAPCEISDDDKRRCARFVRSVRLRVYNRWGKQVYTYQSGGERSIYIDWDGRGDNGKELSTGVYYYVADVVFDSVDPAKSEKTLKGWVQLLR